MLLKRLIFSLLLSICGFSAFAAGPVPGDYKSNFLEGNRLIEENNWSMALLFFREAYSVDSSSANVNYKLGLCYLNSFSEKSQSLRFLRKAARNVTRNYDPYDYKLQKAPENTFYYLAQAYHYNYQFDSALIYFESWKTLVNPKDINAIDDINLRIDWAKNAKDFITSPLPITITNLGDSVNDGGPDYSPVISIDENTLIFTARRYGEKALDGMAYEDIMICEKNPDGTWTAARPISPYVNSNSNEASISLSADGQTLFLYRDWGGGDIYTTTYVNGDWLIPSPMGGDINSKYWETHACLSADGNTLYFVSDRPGGFGGRDIYRCVNINGRWSKALNLGPTINTANDEDSPFIHPDQKTLFFSSTGHKSMGGFDIFFTAKNDSGQWVEPINIGYPINTPDDDIFYTTSPDGKRAYFSSVRQGGYGDKDVYMAELEKPTTQPLTLLKGRIYNANGKPLTQKIDINVINSTTGQLAGLYKPNQRGSFTIILIPGNTYQISYYVDDIEYSNEVIDVPAGSEFEVIERAVDLRDLVLGTAPIDVPLDTAKLVGKNPLPGDTLSPVPIVKSKNWKAELTQTHNLNFSMSFKYNISEIDPNDADFKTFIDSCVAHINKYGEINFRITAAASQVPTRKFKTNKDLSKDRAAKAQAVVNKALEARGIDMTKVHWVKVNAYVLGPQYKSDFEKNKLTYEKYQYVKIRGY
jgi:Tol biopolymer transport system component